MPHPLTIGWLPLATSKRPVSDKAGTQVEARDWGSTVKASISTEINAIAMLHGVREQQYMRGPNKSGSIGCSNHRSGHVLHTHKPLQALPN